MKLPENRIVTVILGESGGVNTMLLVICGCLTWSPDNESHGSYGKRCAALEAVPRAAPKICRRESAWRPMGTDQADLSILVLEGNASRSKPELIIRGEYLPHIIFAYLHIANWLTTVI
jgi:hypothetical protein